MAVANIIILAGGAGMRLWPYSNREQPKHLLGLGTHSTLFADTLVRALELGPTNVVVVTSSKDAIAVRQEIATVHQGDRAGANAKRCSIAVLVEPSARNTAPAIALAVRYLKKIGAPTQTLCLPADHVITPLDAFVHDVSSALPLVNDGRLVVFGIPATAPETGYGYIESGEAYNTGFTVTRFHEKPDLETAQNFCAAGNFFWNSGMFAFSTEMMWGSLAQYEPAIVEQFEKSGDAIFDMQLTDSVAVHSVNSELKVLYQLLPPISIDNAVAERSDSIAMVATSFEWHDLGCWDEVARMIERKIVVNPTPNPPIEIDATNNVVVSDMEVGIFGVNDIIVVIKNGRALICKRGESQHIKSIAAKSQATEDVAAQKQQ